MLAACGQSAKKRWSLPPRHRPSSPQPRLARKFLQSPVEVTTAAPPTTVSAPETEVPAAAETSTAVADETSMLGALGCNDSPLPKARRLTGISGEAPKVSTDSWTRFTGERLKKQYDITLNRVPLADTVDAINQVLSEKEANKDPGVVDIIWINGENFASLKQAGMLYDNWNRMLPNSALVNYDNAALNLDFGNPIGELESPWSSAQFQFIYDSARTDGN